MLTGSVLFADIAEHVGCHPSTVSAALRDPVACAFVHRHIEKLVQRRLGAVVAALFNRAVGGNVSAAKLVLERFGALVQRSVSVNVSADLADLTDDELDTMIAGRSGELSEQPTVIDVEASESPQDRS